MWILRTIDPDSARTFRLLPGQTRTIGRATGVDFIIDAPLVSRVHCRVSASDAGDLTVTDLDSTNGMLVNGDRVASAPLKAGDRLTVGRVELLVEKG